MIAQLDRVDRIDRAPTGSANAVGVLARRLARALETKEVELAVARHEISELKRARERDLNLRRLGEAQAALAHQMRTPLTVAGLHVDQLLLDVEDGAPRRRLQKVRASLGAVERQIRNALVFVTGRLGERAAFNVNSLVEFLRDSLAPLESVHPIVWRVDPLDAFPLEAFPLDGDKAVLAGAIVNLVENAAAVGGSGVTVVLDVHTTADRVEIAVVDDGPGMSRELLARIRVPFVSERAGGTGLGLAIADRVVEAHGGQLTIESRPGQGTCVRIVLPRAAGVSA